MNLSLAGIALENASAGFHDRYKSEWDDEVGYTVYETSRSIGVRAGGAIGGVYGGPVGAFVGGVCGGAITDSVATVVTDRPQGLVRDFANIADDIAKDKDPTRDAFVAAVQIASDGVNGMVMSRALGGATGAGEIAQLVAKEALKISAGKVTRTVVRVHM